METKDNPFYEMGKAYKELGECLMNVENTIDDLTKCAYKCGLKITFSWKEKPKESNLNIPIEELELSVRSTNALRKLNIETVGELLNYTEHQLLGNLYFGRKSLIEITKALAERNLFLKGCRG